jgi:hypothetical protein
MQAVLRLVLICLVLLAQNAQAHGGVMEEEDLCVIKINYLSAHFKIYQPQIDGHTEYCEDLPNATETVFVMEFLHDAMREVAIDFRIIRDVTGKGRFARWEDVAEIDDIDSVTVFYQQPTVEPDVFTVIHSFDAEGDYIGIVTAAVDDTDRIYTAVFPFEVGFTGLGYWPFIIALLLAIQIQYFIMSGRFARWRAKRNARKSDLGVALLFLMLLMPVMWVEVANGDDKHEWVSENGAFAVSFDSSLQPIVINQIHTWVLHIETDDAAPVSGAEVSVIGGMPAHDHGLPTRPRVSKELGDGDYRLEGMRFHMQGDWEISITISAGGSTDTVKIALQL